MADRTITAAQIAQAFQRVAEGSDQTDPRNIHGEPVYQLAGPYRLQSDAPLAERRALVDRLAGSPELPEDRPLSLIATILVSLDVLPPTGRADARSGLRTDGYMAQPIGWYIANQRIPEWFRQDWDQAAVDLLCEIEQRATTEGTTWGQVYRDLSFRLAGYNVLSGLRDRPSLLADDA